jgi:hypothetical protein
LASFVNCNFSTPLFLNLKTKSKTSYFPQLLPDNVVDPMELLSYLDPPDLATPPSSGSSSTGANGTPGGNTTSDDILALFE